MVTDGAAAYPIGTGGGGKAERYREGPLAPYVATDALLEVANDRAPPAGETYRTVLAAHQLHDVADYRGALQAWFAAVATGGHLIIIVPHAFLYERQLELPTSLNPGQWRLYTPASLMAEVEEALAPNSYRVRLLGDDDAGYDYATPKTAEPAGHSDVLLVLEKIARPAWNLALPLEGIRARAPDYAWEPKRTRVEAPIRPDIKRVLILKLDHMGDFIMALAALEKARALFADAEITLVVGSWNEATARELNLADHVIAFDAFPRNSTEQKPDVAGRVAMFREAVTGEYDLAIDLRTDVDTRVLLKTVKAPLKAGIGTAAQFPFLDIFLPLDFNRNRPETAREYFYNNHAFISQGPVERRDHRSISRAETVEREWAIFWGPYERLRPGRYFFEPAIEAAEGQEGMLLLDVAVDTERVASMIYPALDRPRLDFTVDKADSQFEFRIYTIKGAPSLDFSFYGGRLVRQGAGSVLHQSEYSQLMIELVALRLNRTGILADVVQP